MIPVHAYHEAVTTMAILGFGVPLIAALELTIWAALVGWWRRG